MSAPVVKWSCPINHWCENTGCKGEECESGWAADVSGTLDPFFSSSTDPGVEFPAATMARQLVDGVLGVTLTIRQPGHRRQPQLGGPWVWDREKDAAISRGAGSQGVPGQGGTPHPTEAASYARPKRR